MKIAIVTSDFYGFVRNGGVGTSMYHFAELFQKSGHKVDILFANPIATEQNFSFNFFKHILKRKKINLLSLHNLGSRVESGYYAPTTAFLTYLKLKTQKYDQIFFNDLGGQGYYCFLSQNLLNTFSKTRLSLLYHGPTKWHILNNQSPVDRYSQVVLEATERLSLEAAPDVIFATKYAQKSAIKLGYQIDRNKSTVCMFPFNFDQKKASVEVTTLKKQVVFFGRLEKRKGLLTFLGAILINKDLFRGGFATLLFLGSSRLIDGIRSEIFVLDWARKHDLSIQIITQADSETALDFLTKTNSVAVIASNTETLGYTLAECIVNNIPYISSDIEPFNEIHKFFKKSNPYQFNAGDSMSLAKTIKSCIGNWPERQKPMNFNDVRKLQSQRWQALLARPLKITKTGSPKKKLVLAIAIVVVEREVGFIYFKELVRSLKKLKDYPDEILVLANGLSIANLKKLKKIEHGLRNFRIFETKEKVNVSRAKNLLAKKSEAEFIFFVDDDNEIHSSNFNQYASSILNSNSDIMVANMLIKQQALRNEKTFRIFLSNEPNLNLINNLAGDGNLIVRRKSFLNVKGFNESLNFGEDQDLLLRFSVQGLTYQLTPEPLVIYRKHKDSLTANAQYEDRHDKLVSALTRSFGQKTSFEIFHSYLVDSFERDDAVNGQSTFLENYYTNNLKNSTLSDENFQIFKKHFSNKIKLTDQIPFLELSDFKPNKMQIRTEIKVELSVHSSRSATMTTSIGETFHLFVGHNNIVCLVCKDTQISISTRGNETLLAIENVRYAN